MSKRLISKIENRNRRAGRVRASLTGSSTRPRLSVHVSNLHVTAQLIDDQAGKTLGYATTIGHKEAKGTLTDKASWVGSEIAKQAKTAKVSKVAFDRGGRIYHGRVAALADAARKAGLEF